MAVISEVRIGDHGCVRIHDDYLIRDETEKQKIISNVADLLADHYTREVRA